MDPANELSDPGIEEFDDLDSEIGRAFDEQEATEAVEVSKEVVEAPEAVKDDWTPLSAPDRWKPEFKEAFSTLANWRPGDPPPDGMDPQKLAKAWLDFHTDRQAYITPLEQERARYQHELEQYQQAVAPYQQTWQMSGMSPAQGISQLLAWGGALQKDPQGTLRHLAKTVGVDLGELTQEQDWQDPQVAHLSNQVNQLQSALVNREREAITRQQHQQQAAIEQQLASFATAADDHGKSLHPDYQTLEPVMAGLYGTAYGQVQQGIRQAMPTLEELYEQAAWAHPEVRARLQKEQDAAVAAQKASAAGKAASASRTVKSKGAGNDNSPSKSMEEEIAAIWDAQVG